MRPYASLAAGGMVNVSTDEAWGFSGLIGVGDAAARLGLQGRYRKWLSPERSVEFAAGPFRYYGGSDAHMGAAADVRYHWRDWASASTRVEVAQHPNAGTVGGIFLGGTVGSKPAAIVVLVGGGIVGLLYLSLVLSCVAC